MRELEYVGSDVREPDYFCGDEAWIEEYEFLEVTVQVF